MADVNVRDCVRGCVCGCDEQQGGKTTCFQPSQQQQELCSSAFLTRNGAVRHVVKAKVEGDQVPLDGRLRLRHEPPVKARDARSRVARPAVADVKGAVLDLGHAVSAEDRGHATYVADRNAVPDDEDIWHRGRRRQAGAHLTAERVAGEDRAEAVATASGGDGVVAERDRASERRRGVLGGAAGHARRAGRRAIAALVRGGWRGMERGKGGGRGHQ